MHIGLKKHKERLDNQDAVLANTLQELEAIKQFLSNLKDATSTAHSILAGIHNALSESQEHINKLKDVAGMLDTLFKDYADSRKSEPEVFEALQVYQPRVMQSIDKTQEFYAKWQTILKEAELAVRRLL